MSSHVLMIQLTRRVTISITDAYTASSPMTDTTASHLFHTSTLERGASIVQEVNMPPCIKIETLSFAVPQSTFLNLPCNLTLKVIFQW